MNSENKLFSICKEEEINIIVIDTLQSVTTGINLSKPDECGAFINPFLLKCREKGYSVIIAHHSNKSKIDYTYQGSTVLASQLDTVLELKKLSSDIEEGNIGFKISFNKARSCERIYQTPFECTLDKLQQPYHWIFESSSANITQKILDLIKESGNSGIRSKEICEELEISKPLVSYYVKKLIGDNRVTRDNIRSPIKYKPSGGFKGHTVRNVELVI
jgi:hypothetical protein